MVRQLDNIFEDDIYTGKERRKSSTRSAKGCRR